MHARNHTVHYSMVTEGLLHKPSPAVLPSARLSPVMKCCSTSCRSLSCLSSAAYRLCQHILACAVAIRQAYFPCASKPRTVSILALSTSHERYREMHACIMQGHCPFGHNCRGSAYRMIKSSEVARLLTCQCLPHGGRVRSLNGSSWHEALRIAFHSLQSKPVSQTTCSACSMQCDVSAVRTC